MAVDFVSQIKPIGVEPLNGQRIGSPSKDQAKEFSDLLGKLQSSTKSLEAVVSQDLKFSNHAVDRMRTRGIQLEPEQLQKLQDGVDKAQKKGGQNSLIFVDDAAFIVSVKNKTVVTVMDRLSVKENVFTNIDSTVVM